MAVVVATYRRASLLPRLVRALDEQVDAPPFELVVVDDASPDETAGVLAGLAEARAERGAEEGGGPVRVVRLPANLGQAAARNAGWRSTAAQLIAFTDDDCVPAPRWLAELTGGLADADIVQGRTAPNPDQLDRLGPFSRTLDVPELNGFFQTCNIGYRRHWLERVGGFDEDFGRLAGEDADLAWRAIDLGATATFAAGALVHHDVRPSNALVRLKDVPRWAGIVRLVSKNPKLRASFHSHRFWQASHRPALVAAAGLLAAAAVPGRARPAGLALLLPYVKHRVVDRPLQRTSVPQRIALLPVSFAVDISEVAVFAAASVRYGQRVL